MLAVVELEQSRIVDTALLQEQEELVVVAVEHLECQVSMEPQTLVVVLAVAEIMVLVVALVAQESSFFVGHKINTKRLHSCQF
jgi:hypothetical protein